MDVQTKAAPTARAWLNPETFEMSHQLRVHLDPTDGAFQAMDRISLSRVPTAAPPRFMLMKSMQVDAIRLGHQPVPYDFKDGILSVKLPDDVKGKSNVQFSVVYHGSVPHDGEVALYDESWWHPNNIGSHGPSQLWVTVPSGVRVAATGTPKSSQPLGHKVRYSWDLEERNPGMAIVAANLDMQTFHRHGLEYRVFPPAGSHMDVGDVVTQSDSIIQFFQKKFGPYPYKKLDIIQGGAPESGEGEPSVIQMGSAVFSSADKMRDFLPHEISHNWWANSVMGFSQDGLWYEAFAEMSSFLYNDAQGRGKEMEQTRKATLERWTREIGPGGSTPVGDIKGYDGDEVENVAYGKGFFVLSQLRDKIGDPAFIDGMRLFCTRFTSKLPTWQDAQKCFEDTSGQPLGPFFSQWLERRGAPDLSVNDLQVVPAGDGYQVRGKLCQKGEVYDLDVPMKVDLPSGPVQFKIKTSSVDQAFDIALPARPTNLTIDPHFQVFRLLKDDDTCAL